ncbi:hypothetical protein [Streptomyces sp. NPDC048521]|uniref:hypothetical protein n=1 Tax=Streptomyces sp. NPDC048521 TaxID=3365566 RepID=UPI00371390B9
MGVFARLLGRSKTTQEASAAEAQAGSEAEGAEAEAAEPAESKSGETKSAEEKSAEAKDAAEDGCEDLTARAEARSGDDASGSADIPKQQSAEGAADNEAGDGARR